MPMQKNAQRLQTYDYFMFVGYIYCIPGHFGFARVPRSHTHTQEHLQAIQELSDQIFSP